MDPLATRIQAIYIFSVMEKVLRDLGEVYRANHYANAVRSLENKTPPLTETFAKKFDEIATTGSLKKYDELMKIRDLIGTPGFGTKTLVAMSRGKFIPLTAMQKIGIKYGKNIIRSLTRSTVELVAKRIERVLKLRNLFDKFIVTGSYRRGEEYGIGDVDILIQQTKTKRSISTPIKKYLKYKRGPTYVATYVDGPKKFSFLVKVPFSLGKYGANTVIYTPEDKFYVHVDIRIIDNAAHFPYALLYFTGSKKFNIHIRNIAKNMNLKLNEYGLYHRDTGEHIEKKLSSEKAIMEYLEMKYIEPTNR